jgi:uncharacterized protein YcsI (UPF0317 family)
MFIAILVRIKREIIQVFFGCGVTKQKVAYPYNGVTLIHKKEQ